MIDATRYRLDPQPPAPADDGKHVPDAAVVVDGVTKTYKTRDGILVEAVRDASFQVRDGEIVSLVGPSGCGKSTLLKMMAGLGAPTSGQIFVGNAPAAAGRRDCGIMLQSAVLLPWRSVLENIMLPIEVFGLDKKEARQRADGLLEFVGLKGFENKHPWELSGGMQQRVSLVRLLVFEPKILLMDEPFAALDEFTRERLDAELLRLHERSQRTLVYVTHNIEESVMLSDKVVVMAARPGEIVGIVDIGLPRPRATDVATTSEGVKYVNKIRGLLNSAEGHTERGEE